MTTEEFANLAFVVKLERVREAMGVLNAAAADGDFSELFEDTLVPSPELLAILIAGELPALGWNPDRRRYFFNLSEELGKANIDMFRSVGAYMTKIRNFD